MNYAPTNRIYLNTKSVDTYTGIKIFDFLNNHPEVQINYAKNNEIIYKEPNLTITNYFANLGKGESNENSIITLIEYYQDKFYLNQQKFLLHLLSR